MQKQKELENEQLKTELSFLKAQINPHFLFNALNNLYALALKQAPETPTTIVQIAGIMRYLLYETNDEKVLLSKEIEIVQDYIALHELKNKSGIGISFKIQGNTDAMLIPPLLLLPLIENIFKHGTYPVNIRIHVTHQLTHQLFNLEAINKIRTTESKVPGGVGLINLKRRLDLLYRDNYQLALEEMGNDFRVSLTLNFNQLNP